MENQQGENTKEKDYSQYLIKPSDLSHQRFLLDLLDATAEKVSKRLAKHESKILGIFEQALAELYQEAGQYETLEERKAWEAKVEKTKEILDKADERLDNIEKVIEQVDNTNEMLKQRIEEDKTNE